MRRRRIKLPPVAVDALRQQREAFRRKFGREPGPDDPIFFDPEKDTPAPLGPEWLTSGERKMAGMMLKVGIDPKKVYAFMTTGLMVTHKGMKNFSRAEIREWDDACRRWDAMTEAERRLALAGIDH